MDKIEIFWQGPISLDDAIQFKLESDYGIYQIYGTHNILGANTLLYIGKAQGIKYGERLLQHKAWMEYGFSDFQIYLGRLGGTKKISNEEWDEQIITAEKLLIYYCSPPYNSSNINDYGNISDTIVLNFGKKCQIPVEVSTLYWDSEFWNKENWRKSEIWQEYNGNKV